MTVTAQMEEDVAMRVTYANGSVRDLNASEAKISFSECKTLKAASHIIARMPKDALLNYRAEMRAELKMPVEE